MRIILYDTYTYTRPSFIRQGVVVFFSLHRKPYLPTVGRTVVNGKGTRPLNLRLFPRVIKANAKIIICAREYFFVFCSTRLDFHMKIRPDTAEFDDTQAYPTRVARFYIFLFLPQKVFAQDGRFTSRLLSDFVKKKTLRCFEFFTYTTDKKTFRYG